MDDRYTKSTQNEQLKGKLERQKYSSVLASSDDGVVNSGPAYCRCLRCNEGWRVEQPYGVLHKEDDRTCGWCGNHIYTKSTRNKYHNSGK